MQQSFQTFRGKRNFSIFLQLAFSTTEIAFHVGFRDFRTRFLMARDFLGQGSTALNDHAMYSLSSVPTCIKNKYALLFCRCLGRRVTFVFIAGLAGTTSLREIPRRRKFFPRGGARANRAYNDANLSKLSVIMSLANQELSWAKICSIDSTAIEPMCFLCNRTGEYYLVLCMV